MKKIFLWASLWIKKFCTQHTFNSSEYFHFGTSENSLETLPYRLVEFNDKKMFLLSWNWKISVFSIIFGYSSGGMLLCGKLTIPEVEIEISRSQVFVFILQHSTYCKLSSVEVHSCINSIMLLTKPCEQYSRNVMR